MDAKFGVKVVESAAVDELLKVDELLTGHELLTADAHLDAVLLDLRCLNGMDAAARVMRLREAGWPMIVVIATPDAGRPTRPRLSDRERSVLVGYVSGLTLKAVASHLGIKPDTAKTYLERAKAKYRDAGRPTYTKLDLVERLREDGIG
jgi:DNA-binding CsgD family transcriptional regulator